MFVDPFYIINIYIFSPIRVVLVRSGRPNTTAKPSKKPAATAAAVATDKTVSTFHNNGSLFFFLFVFSPPEINFNFFNLLVA